MAVKINFLYRDAANYKVWNHPVVRGTATEEQIKEIENCLFDGEYFYPQMVGLPAEDFVSLGYAPYDDDPDWFEFDSIEETKEPATVDLDFEDLLENFKLCAKYRWSTEKRRCTYGNR